MSLPQSCGQPGELFRQRSLLDVRGEAASYEQRVRWSDRRICDVATSAEGIRLRRTEHRRAVAEVRSDGGPTLRSATRAGARATSGVPARNVRIGSAVLEFNQPEYLRRDRCIPGSRDSAIPQWVSVRWQPVMFFATAALRCGDGHLAVRREVPRVFDLAQGETDTPHRVYDVRRTHGHQFPPEGADVRVEDVRLRFHGHSPDHEHQVAARDYSADVWDSTVKRTNSVLVSVVRSPS